MATMLRGRQSCCPAGHLDICLITEGSRKAPCCAHLHGHRESTGLAWVKRWAPGRLPSGGPGQLTGWKLSGGHSTDLLVIAQGRSRAAWPH